ncbi:hypothetical protein BH695_2897 [Microcystis aeruginosa PCC 7806SL]|uniref:Uncharacterized protein n=1 Tax=Microcystis aeruginosa PCC 7806SL TaxID=1903187 RepID=A0AB33BZT5_MICA7|nr:hypothetical protein BH695_2897 [Microcystis aeruginosa PCC 7806SL]
MVSTFNCSFSPSGELAAMFNFYIGKTVITNPNQFLGISRKIYPMVAPKSSDFS